ncbi:aldehyde dehydrogenase (NADP(+)) [Streptomyces sp. NPDC047525]|uniref:aldehyde dehydrogenase (NADP(+)) n=1 Tax=Streptomyces sp. NPDC047525 TaxID=3155264 RepID=UPI0033F51EC2
MTAPVSRLTGHQLTGHQLIGHQLIGGESTPGDDASFHAVDPRTGLPLEPPFTAASSAQVERAASLAAQAFDTYRHTTPEVRAAFLDSIAARIEGLGPQLRERVIAESGLPAPRVESETARTTGQLRLFADHVREGGWRDVHIDTPRPDRTPLPRPDLRRRQIPLGPVAVFAASNFPLAFSVAGGDTASALAAGAPVVVKAHPSHPGTSELVGRAVQAAAREHGLPEGVFSLLHGPSEELGRALVTDPRIKAVGFTGSRGGGLALAAAAAARPEPIPVFAEMSSTNPVFLLPHALRQDAGELGRAFIASMTNATGQLCTSPGLVFAAEGADLEAFVEAASAAVSGHTAAPMLSTGIRDGYERGLARAEAVDGVVVRGRGTDDPAVTTAGRAAVLVTDAATFLDHPELRDEVFGPAALVVRVPAGPGLETVARALDGQLTATVHAVDADREQAANLLDILELKAGRVLFNGWPTGVEVGHAVIHGGPYPSTTAPATTSVGTGAIARFLRPVSYQNVPAELLPPELGDDNPLHLWRRVDGTPTRG